MRSLLALTLVAFVFVGCEAALDAPTGDLTLETRDALAVLPADAAFAGMMNFRAMQSSAAVQRATGNQFGVDALEGESKARFDEFVRLTGFNPEEDLDRAYFAVTRADQHDHPAFVVYADFDRARLDAYIDDNADADLRRTTYNDLPVYLTTEDGDTFGFALVNDEMLVAAQESTLHAMLDRVASGQGGLQSDAAMMRLIERAAHPDDAWFAVRGLDQRSTDDAHDHSLSGLVEASGQLAEAVISIGFESDGIDMQMAGIPRAGASGGDLADLIRGSIAAMRATSSDEPEVYEMLDGIRVRESGDAVTVSAFVDADVLAQMRDQDYD
ncbi:MAG: hypothetical protein HKN04_08280 [Rhodothermaceae bacterium]|nr:hypothetical protein [Rhodothermaceae bacterium]